MNDPKKVTILDLKSQYTLGLRIPEIQRDYVMGAGGMDGDGKDKLEKLLDVILKKCKSNEDFDFSCIITYCSDPENAPLEIYDGQQRLTTLMIMILYKLRSERKDVTGFADWYSFMGRPRANDILELLVKNESEIENIEVTDFTSFSIKNLLKKIALAKYGNITSDYLLNHVKFDMVSIGSQNEIEQFFMDLNSGVKLKEYELYKAKLTHRVSQLKREYDIDTKDEALEMWPHKMDNDWLNFFAIFADYEHPAEEYETAFVKYCINMVYHIDRMEPINMQADTISVDIIKQVYDIMQMITQLDLSLFRHKDEDQLKQGILYYSWGQFDSDIRRLHNYKRRGVFWKLDFEEYDKILYYIIKFVLLDANKSSGMKDDALLWCFITTLDWKIDVQNEYLRLIKIILNHNVEENLDAWFECQYKGQYLYYCKYSVYAIPQYYGEHINLKTDNVNVDRHSNMFLLNRLVIQNVKISNMLSREKIASNLMEQIRDIIKEDKVIESIINTRIQLLQMPKFNYNEDYIEKENAIFGIVSKITQPIDEKHHYLARVNLNWPTRGYNSPLDCWVRLKWKTDLLFTEFQPDNHNIVEKTVSKMGEEFIDECFWTDSNTVKRLIDRVTDTSTTYNKKDSPSGWCDTWSLD